MNVVLRTLLCVAVIGGLSCVELQVAITDLTTGDPPVVPPRTMDLGSLGGGSRSAMDINDNGMVIGFADVEDVGDHAFRWTAEDGMIDLGTSGGLQSRAFGVNINGEVCGVSQGTDGEPNDAVVWSATGEVRVLARLADGDSEANDINDLGQVCGSSTAEDDILRAVLWEPDGTLVVLGPLGGPRTISSAINNLSQVTGTGEVELGGDSRAFVWSAESGIESLGTLGGNLSQGFGIDDLGRVVGRANLEEGGNRYAFVWTRERGMIDLGALGGPGSEAFALNTDGIIIGESSVVSGGVKAFVATIDGGMRQLPDLGARATNTARGINRHGSIVGFANDPNRVTRAIQWVE